MNSCTVTVIGGGCAGTIAGECACADAGSKYGVGSAALGLGRGGSPKCAVTVIPSQFQYAGRSLSSSHYLEHDCRYSILMFLEETLDITNTVRGVRASAKVASQPFIPETSITHGEDNFGIGKSAQGLAAYNCIYVSREFAA